jgi:hypothetical protein
MTIETQLRGLAAMVTVEQRPVTAKEVLLRAGQRPMADDRSSWRGWGLAAATVALLAGGLIGLLAWGRAVEDGPLPVVSTPATVAPATTAPTTSLPPAVTMVMTPWPATADTETTTQVLERKVIQSSIGNLRWTVIESAPGAERPPASVLRGPRGYVAVRDDQLIFSDDAVSWNAAEASFPGLPNSVVRLRSGEFRLVVRTADGAYQNWDSTDLETWNLAVDPLVTVAFDDWVYGPEVLRIRRHGTDLPNGSTLASVEIGLDIGGGLAQRLSDEEGRRLFAEYGSESWWVPSDGDGLSGIAGAAVVTSSSWGTWDEAKAGSVATVEVEVSISGSADDWVVDVRNPETGVLLGTARGSIGAPDLRTTLEALVYSRLTAEFVIEGDGAELVRPAWANTSQQDWPSVRFVTTPEGLLAYARAGGDPGGVAEVWRTNDGRTWEELGAPGGLPDGPLWRLGPVLTMPDGRFVTVLYQDPGISTLTSNDGVDWQPASRPPPASGQPGDILSATDRGVMLFTGSDDQEFQLWTSPDGDVWEPVDAAEVISHHQTGLTYTGEQYSGSTPDMSTVTRSFEQGRTITWLVEEAP